MYLLIHSINLTIYPSIYLDMEIAFCRAYCGSFGRFWTKFDKSCPCTTDVAKWVVHGCPVDVSPISFAMVSIIVSPGVELGLVGAHGGRQGSGRFHKFWVLFVHVPIVRALLLYLGSTLGSLFFLGNSRLLLLNNPDGL